MEVWVESTLALSLFSFGLLVWYYWVPTAPYVGEADKLPIDKGQKVPDEFKLRASTDKQEDDGRGEQKVETELEVGSSGDQDVKIQDDASKEVGIPSAIKDVQQDDQLLKNQISESAIPAGTGTEDQSPQDQALGGQVQEDDDVIPGSISPEGLGIEDISTKDDRFPKDTPTKKSESGDKLAEGAPPGEMDTDDKIPEGTLPGEMGTEDTFSEDISPGEDVGLNDNILEGVSPGDMGTDDIIPQDAAPDAVGADNNLPEGISLGEMEADDIFKEDKPSEEEGTEFPDDKPQEEEGTKFPDDKLPEEEGTEFPEDMAPEAVGAEFTEGMAPEAVGADDNSPEGISPGEKGSGDKFPEVEGTGDKFPESALVASPEEGGSDAISPERETPEEIEAALQAAEEDKPLSDDVEAGVGKLPSQVGEITSETAEEVADVQETGSRLSKLIAETILAEPDAQQIKPSLSKIMEEETNAEESEEIEKISEIMDGDVFLGKDSEENIEGTLSGQIDATLAETEEGLSLKPEMQVDLASEKEKKTSDECADLDEELGKAGKEEPTQEADADAQIEEVKISKEDMEQHLEGSLVEDISKKPLDAERELICCPSSYSLLDADEKRTVCSDWSVEFIRETLATNEEPLSANKEEPVQEVLLDEGAKIKEAKTSKGEMGQHVEGTLVEDISRKPLDTERELICCPSSYSLFDADEVKEACSDWSVEFTRESPITKVKPLSEMQTKLIDKDRKSPVRDETVTTHQTIFIGDSKKIEICCPFSSSDESDLESCCSVSSITYTKEPLKVELPQQSKRVNGDIRGRDNTRQSLQGNEFQNQYQRTSMTAKPDSSEIRQKSEAQSKQPYETSKPDSYSPQQRNCSKYTGIKGGGSRQSMETNETQSKRPSETVKSDPYSSQQLQIKRPSETTKLDPYSPQQRNCSKYTGVKGGEKRQSIQRNEVKSGDNTTIPMQSNEFQSKRSSETTKSDPYSPQQRNCSKYTGVKGDDRRQSIQRNEAQSGDDNTIPMQKREDQSKRPSETAKLDPYSPQQRNCSKYTGVKGNDKTQSLQRNEAQPKRPSEITKSEPYSPQQRDCSKYTRVKGTDTKQSLQKTETQSKRTSATAKSDPYSSQEPQTKPDKEDNQKESLQKNETENQSNRTSEIKKSDSKDSADKSKTFSKRRSSNCEEKKNTKSNGKEDSCLPYSKSEEELLLSKTIGTKENIKHNNDNIKALLGKKEEQDTITERDLQLVIELIKKCKSKMKS